MKVSQIRLVAAHAWDVVGAMRTGCAAPFVARPGMVLNPLATRPDMVGADLRELAEQILEIATTPFKTESWRSCKLLPPKGRIP